MKKPNLPRLVCCRRKAGYPQDYEVLDRIILSICDSCTPRLGASLHNRKFRQARGYGRFCIVRLPELCYEA